MAGMVLANVWLGCDNLLRRRRPLKDRRERATDVIGRLIAAQQLDTPIAELSLNDPQAICAARALLTEPRVLILDEATSAIDEDQEAILYDALATTLPGTTIVSIGHRRSLAAHHDRVIVIERQPGHPGRLVEGLAAA